MAGGPAAGADGTRHHWAEGAVCLLPILMPLPQGVILTAVASGTVTRLQVSALTYWACLVLSGPRCGALMRVAMGMVAAPEARAMVLPWTVPVVVPALA